LTVLAGAHPGHLSVLPLDIMSEKSITEKVPYPASAEKVVSTRLPEIREQ
jgi:hypothetical protein